MNEPTLFTPQSSSPFDAIRRLDALGCEYWTARDLMDLFGYARWDDVEAGIERAQLSISNALGVSAAHTNIEASVKEAIVGFGVREIRDYRLTRYAAYVWAMISDPRKSEIAAAQTYFAVKTREAEVAAPQRELSRREILTMALEAEEKAERAQAALAAIAPKVEAYETLMDAQGEYLMRDVAKIIGGIGQNTLFALLRARSVLITGGPSHNTPYQEYADRGWFRVAARTFSAQGGSEARTTYTTYVTAKGLDGIQRIVKNEGSR